MFSFEIGVVFAGDRFMRGLNRAWRGKDTTTDVLSFPMEDDVRACVDRPAGLPPVELGDIVISVPQAVRQAEAYGVTLSEEIARLLVHGTLHLLGYDHERGAAEARAMRRLESAILRKMEKEPLCSN
ncbi:MAG: rRNA maturation RNase YbeY [Nitrospiraceae bacterium]|jgi:rRNA maturation RNase YbeY|nr:rRNA maturation RNase YbeY [Nitrospiraceae bacterium]